MGRFRRAGHWRTNQYGTTHWVSGHSVEREDLRASYALPTLLSNPEGDLFGLRLPNRNALSDGTLPSFTVPNAKCPVCGALVFFYQNLTGSRVFFDDIGPPWPKHPCTDFKPASGHGSSSPNGVNTQQEMLAQADQLTFLLETDIVPTVEQLGLSELTSTGWERWVVKRRKVREDLIHYVATSALNPSLRTLRFSTGWRVPHPQNRDMIYLKDERLSFFDFNSFSPVEVAINRKLTKARVGAKRKAPRSKNRKIPKI